jgi:uncharacterized protein YecT (DUF1311 family)
VAGTAPPAAPAAPAARTAAAAASASAASDARCRSTAAADQRACLLASIDADDAGLTRSYQALIAELRTRAGGAREPATVQALRAEQRAWLQRRDRACPTPAGAGALWGAARVPCFAERSRERAIELDARRRRLGGA